MAEARQISGKELPEELAREKHCVVEFWMKGCPACAHFAPTFGQLAEELAGRANVCTIEAQANMETCRKHNISGVPTVIVFSEGNEAQRVTGAKSLDEMREWLEPALV